MSPALLETPLHAWHAGHGGRLVDFAGWSMPVQYTSIVAEHQSTRTAAGLFDISHMGRLRFDGPRAPLFLDRLLTRHVAPLRPGQVAYSLVTNEAGGILDDVLVSHLVDAAGASYYLLVVNASNRAKIVAWIEQHHGDFADVRVTDVTRNWGMIAVQGPRALEIAQPLVQAPLADLPYYAASETLIDGHGGIASRTGYTGEDGCELIVGNAALVNVWEQLVAAAGKIGGQAVGLGARDTLRLEAAMPLYGHELAEEIDPWQAGLGFAVQLDKGEFLGRAALAALQTDRTRPRRVGLRLAGKRVPREDYAIYAADTAAADSHEQLGYVTSGTFSPTLDAPLAMAYVLPAAAAVGTQVLVDIRGRVEPAEVVKLPFYKRGQASAASAAAAHS
ncbi:MAG: glycine cleavage system aminomethyltransferase GcvT [Planctomycetaceae bacterium]|nr:glycine cleavage system aminomethyltransferase GcvT [Planctomycetaceae bacterium]